MSKFKGYLFLLVTTGIVFFFSTIFLPFILKSSYNTTAYFKKEFQTASTKQAFSVTHIETPTSLKALYMTSCVAGTPSWREQLKVLIDTTELNAVVIDIKDYTGVISFPNDFPKPDILAGCVVSDLAKFIESLHQSGIYVIGRISVFQDPAYTKLFPSHAVRRKSDGGIWHDYKGLSFVDVGAKPYWAYIIELSKRSYELGFDELNFDYIRYPSDGNMHDTAYTWIHLTDSTSLPQTNSEQVVNKSEMLKSFFEYLDHNLKDTGVKLSADLFGMTTTVDTDMNIGQILENALPYFDYISPMVYPSHYPATWSGFANPAEHPYEVVKISMDSAVKREEKWRVLNGLSTSTPSKMRPWLQDFHLGATYGPDKVRAQIQATYDSGLTSWMLWNAGNKYTAEAFLLE